MIALVAVLVAGVSSAQAATISRQLQVGSTGTDVSSLQTFLAQDRLLYPRALVTGYFGSLTESAVTNFQLRNEIPSVGRVGPMTLPIINTQIVNGMYPGMNMGMTSGVYTGATYTGADISAPAINAVQVSLDRYSATVRWDTDEAARGSVYYSTTPLSFNEQLSSVAVSGSVVSTDSNLRTSQNVMISGLQPATTYYYAIYATDQMGNVSISWPSTFRTN